MTTSDMFHKSTDVSLEEIRKFIVGRQNGRLSISFDEKGIPEVDGHFWELRLIVGRHESRRVIVSTSPTFEQCVQEIHQNMHRVDEIQQGFALTLGRELSEDEQGF